MTVLAPLVEGDDDELAAAASAAVRAYCRWHIAPSITETRTLDGPGGTALMLPSLHVTAITAASNDGTDLDVDTLEWSEAGYVRAWYWTRKLRGVSITLTHGYDFCPDDVAQVVKGLMAAGSPVATGRLRQVGQVAYDTTTVSPSVVGLSEFDKAILDHYRVPARP